MPILVCVSPLLLCTNTRVSDVAVLVDELFTVLPAMEGIKSVKVVGRFIHDLLSGPRGAVTLPVILPRFLAHSRTLLRGYLNLSSSTAVVPSLSTMTMASLWKWGCVLLGHVGSSAPNFAPITERLIQIYSALIVQSPTPRGQIFHFVRTALREALVKVRTRAHSPPRSVWNLNCWT